MPVILAFGDSNTWGYAPVQAVRYPKTVRWTGVMARALGEDFEVIEEGLNGRTTVFDDPEEEGRIGLSYFGPCLSVCPLRS
jgi:lysophospholipase L1-like esterase